MCYYNSIKISKKTAVKFNDKECSVPPIDIPIQNGFEYNNYPIVKPLNNLACSVEMAHWEFIPNWINTQEKLIENRKKYATLNAKGETLLDSKMYSQAALQQRCLVLSSGFFEWRHFKPLGAKKEIAYPYYITLNNTLEYFFMAGIYNTTVDTATGELITSFAIVTTQANSVMEQIHNTKKRMPTILPLHLAQEWITPDLSPPQINEIANYQIPSNEFVVHTISKDFRTADNPTEGFVYDELPMIA